MPRSFLGKPHPTPKRLPAPKKQATLNQWITRVVPVFLVGTSVYVGVAARLAAPGSSAQFASSAQRDVGGILASSQQTRVLAAEPAPAFTEKGIENRCKDFNANTIFPLIPLSISVDPSKDPSAAEARDTCSPAFWNLYVFMVIAYKLLGLLNWAAGALAVGLTVYAGILYLMGFANEANVKKAKTVLVAAYVGFVIVLSARLILYGTVQAVTDKDPSQAVEDAANGVIGTPTPTPKP